MRLSNMECGDCLAYLFKDGIGGYYQIVEACASVGIEYGKSADQMMQEFIQEYHNRRHRD